MAVCVTVQDGTGVLMITGVPVDQCGSYVLLSLADYQKIPAFFPLSFSDVQLLIPAIAAVLVLAFGLKLVRRFLFS
jgi:hypothetical protein